MILKAKQDNKSSVIVSDKYYSEWIDGFYYLNINGYYEMYSEHCYSHALNLTNTPIMLFKIKL